MLPGPRLRMRIAGPAWPDTRVGMSDERSKDHRGDKEYGHAQQDDIDDAAQVVDNDGPLTPQCFQRRGQLAAYFRDDLTPLDGPPIECGQPLRLEAAQQFAPFPGKRIDNLADRSRRLGGNGFHYQCSLPVEFLEDDPSLAQDEWRDSFRGRSHAIHSCGAYVQVALNRRQTFGQHVGSHQIEFAPKLPWQVGQVDARLLRKSNRQVLNGADGLQRITA